MTSTPAAVMALALGERLSKAKAVGRQGSAKTWTNSGNSTKSLAGIWFWERALSSANWLCKRCLSRAVVISSSGT